MNIHIKIKALREGAKLPVYSSAMAAGADLHACLTEAVALKPGERTIIPTGLAIELPEGYEAQVRPRSGIAIKNGVTVLNAPGTVDADYRGEIGVMLLNTGDTNFLITHGDRIAQMVIKEAPQFTFEWTNDMSETERGEGGYGSTGLAGE